MRIKTLFHSLLLSALIPTAAFANNALFSTLEGQWAWEDKGCKTDSFTINFSNDNHTAVFQSKKDNTKTSIYTILASDATSAHMFLNNEDRHTANGSLVLWVLVMEGTDAYRWKRTDWVAGKLTETKVIRCK